MVYKNHLSIASIVDVPEKEAEIKKKIGYFDFLLH